MNSKNQRNYKQMKNILTHIPTIITMQSPQEKYMNQFKNKTLALFSHSSNI